MPKGFSVLIAVLDDIRIRYAFNDVKCAIAWVYASPLVYTSPHYLSEITRSEVRHPRECCGCCGCCDYFDVLISIPMTYMCPLYVSVAKTVDRCHA